MLILSCFSCMGYYSNFRYVFTRISNIRLLKNRISTPRIAKPNYISLIHHRARRAMTGKKTKKKKDLLRNPNQSIAYIRGEQSGWIDDIQIVQVAAEECVLGKSRLAELERRIFGEAEKCRFASHDPLRMGNAFIFSREKKINAGLRLIKRDSTRCRTIVKATYSCTNCQRTISSDKLG